MTHLGLAVLWPACIYECFPWLAEGCFDASYLWSAVLSLVGILPWLSMPNCGNSFFFSFFWSPSIESDFLKAKYVYITVAHLNYRICFSYFIFCSHWFLKLIQKVFMSCTIDFWKWKRSRNWHTFKVSYHFHSWCTFQVVANYSLFYVAPLLPFSSTLTSATKHFYWAD